MRTFGKYRLLEQIASGGMADVWRAEVTGAEGVVKEVALKLVRGEHAARGDFVRMFVREARLASRLGHANVVQLFEFDQVDGRYYIAMELVRGRHLGTVVARAREAGIRLGLPRAVHVAAEVAKGLAHAHRLSEGGRPLGLVHRDVSPHNVLVSFEGEVKLADFGIARAMDAAGFTEPGTVKGKIAYMAPEQARGELVDARADVFSLGVVLWELCTGRRLFARESDAATLAAVLGDEAISPPSAWNGEVPPELDAAVAGALERDPSRRTRSAQELGTALAGVLLRVTRAPEDVDLRAFMQRIFEAEIAAQAIPPEPTRVRPVPVAAEPVAEPLRDDDARSSTAPTVVAPPPRRGRRHLAGVVIAAGAAAAALGGVAAIASRRATPEPRSVRIEAGAPATKAAAGTPTTTPTTIPTPTPTTTTDGDATSSTTTADEHADATSRVTPSPPARAGGEGRGEGAPERAAPAALPTTTPTPAAATASAAPDPDGAKAGRARGRPPAVRPLASTPRLNALPIPPRSSGEGILSVNAIPWGLVRVNGFDVGETPQELRLPAGRHRVRIEQGERAREGIVTVRAGERTTFFR